MSEKINDKKLLIEIVRKEFHSTCTTGEMRVNSMMFCYTLEDVVREVEGKPVLSWKIPKRTAIPCGDYEVTMSFSQRFKTELPLLLSVEGFTGVRIHSGNSDEDTEGCPLVGYVKSGTTISRSRDAINDLKPMIKTAIECGCKIILKVRNDYPHVELI